MKKKIMTSLRWSLLLFFFFVTMSEGGKKKRQKIIIHVPYKIQKHHHTHTNYKVISVPEKKEKIVIVYKQEEPKKPEFHYVSIPEYKKSPTFSEIKHIPTKFILDSHPIAESSFIKEDNAAQQNNNQYKNILLRTMMRGGILIGDPTQCTNIKPQLSTHSSLNKNLKTVNLETQSSTNKFILTKTNTYRSKKLKRTENTSNENQECEHVGYLIIGKNSHKIVDKNFQDIETDKFI